MGSVGGICSLWLAPVLSVLWGVQFGSIVLAVMMSRIPQAVSVLDPVSNLLLMH